MCEKSPPHRRVSLFAENIAIGVVDFKFLQPLSMQGD